MIVILNNPQLQGFMQIYPEKPDLDSMLQFSSYAAYMQQHAAAWAFFHSRPFISSLGARIMHNLKKLGNSKLY